MTLESTGTPILYLGFTLLVIALLAVDFLVLKTQGAHQVTLKEAAAWSLVWIAISLLFGAWFWWYLDGHFGREVPLADGVDSHDFARGLWVSDLPFWQTGSDQ